MGGCLCTVICLTPCQNILSQCELTTHFSLKGRNCLINETLMGWIFQTCKFIHSFDFILFISAPLDKNEFILLGKNLILKAGYMGQIPQDSDFGQNVSSRAFVWPNPIIFWLILIFSTHCQCRHFGNKPSNPSLRWATVDIGSPKCYH